MHSKFCMHDVNVCLPVFLIYRYFHYFIATYILYMLYLIKLFNSGYWYYILAYQQSACHCQLMWMTLPRKTPTRTEGYWPVPLFFPPMASNPATTPIKNTYSSNPANKCYSLPYIGQAGSCSTSLTSLPTECDICLTPISRAKVPFPHGMLIKGDRQISCPTFSL